MKGTQQLRGMVRESIWKDGRIPYDRIKGNEIVTTLSALANHWSPLIDPLRKVPDNSYQLKVKAHKRASESYFKDGRGKLLNPEVLKKQDKSPTT